MSPVVFGTAADHVHAAVPRAGPDERVNEILLGLQGGRFDTVAEVAVCDPSGRLLGLINIEDLLAASPETAAGALMDADPVVVAPGVDQEVAAWKAVHRGESSLAVVDERGMFLGLIPPERIIEVLLQEHAEDLARFGGFLHSADSARLASEESVTRRLWHRLPWLGLGLMGAVASAQLVGGFEGVLRSQLALAFFLPGVVYLADAVGTQTETLVVRGLSLGVPVRRIVKREALTGVIVGVILAGLFFPAALVLWGQGRIALTVAIALFSACSIATLVAMALPWALQRLGRDPAYGSGPLATVIQDLASIAIYLAAAALLAG